MSSPRLRAQLGLAAATFMLISCMSIIYQGRESLRPKPGQPAPVASQTMQSSVAMSTATPHFGH